MKGILANLISKTSVCNTTDRWFIFISVYLFKINTVTSFISNYWYIACFNDQTLFISCSSWTRMEQYFDQWIDNWCGEYFSRRALRCLKETNWTRFDSNCETEHCFHSYGYCLFSVLYLTDVVSLICLCSFYSLLKNKGGRLLPTAHSHRVPERHWKKNRGDCSSASGETTIAFSSKPELALQLECHKLK